MAGDWLATPVNGYLGSDYGQDLKRVLHSPLSLRLGDEQIAKLRADVPVLSMLPGEAVNLYKVEQGPDRLHLILDIAGHTLPFEG